MMRKKTGFYCLWLCLTLLLFPQSVSAEKKGDAVREFKNVVLFVQFSELDEGDPTTNFMNTVPESYAGTTYTNEALKFWENDGAYVKSLTSYTGAISYGQLHVTNILPQYDAGTGVITPYVLDSSILANENETALIQGCMDLLTKQLDPGVSLDGDGDGMIDNVTFVPYMTQEPNERDGSFYPHKADYPGAISVGGARLGVYNVIDSYHAFEDSYIREGVVCHEFLHSVGFPDLYKESGSEEPVKFWDLMATTSPFLQYPLAYTRAVCGGWLTMDTITEDASLTLDPAEQASGNQAYILKSPLSDTEFFVVEFRKKGTAIDGLEYEVPGSGLIMYRIDTKVERLSNHGNGNAIVVLGPGINGVAMDNTQISNCYLSAESGRTTYGSTDLDATDGALLFSNGTNSGIVISEVGSAEGDKLSFRVSFADYAAADLWDTLGSGTILKDSVQQISLAQDTNGTPYLAAIPSESGRICVQRFDGTNWVTVGGNVSSVPAASVQLVLYKNTPYVLYQESTDSFYMHLSRYNGNAWEDVSGSLGKTNPQYVAAAVDDSGIYLTCGAGDFGSGYRFDLLRYDGNAFTMVAEQFVSGGYALPALDVSGGKVYWAARNYSQNQIEAKCVDVASGAVTDISGSVQGSGVFLAADTSGVYMVVGSDQGGVKACQIKDQAMVQIGDTLSEAQTIYYDITALDGRVCATTNVVENGRKQIVNWTWSEGKWQQVGGTVAKEEATGLQTIANGKEIYTAYTVAQSDGEYVTVCHKTTEIPPVPTTTPTAVPKPTVKNGFLVEGGKKYYYINNVKQKGWKKVQGTWYYMDNTGVVKTGWLKTGGKWYYLKSTGAMATGWAKVGGKWYYLNGSGAMVTGWLKTGGKWYYLTGSGAMATGWLKTGGKWYYLTGSGAMATGWIKTGGRWYYLYGSGAMASSTWIGRYYVNSSGAWTKSR